MTVVPVLVAGVIGFAIGAGARPHGRHLATPVLVLPAVAVIGAGLQLLGALDPPAASLVLAASLALLSGFAIVNRHLVGMGVLAVGLCCNFLAVLVHDGMPVRASALVVSGAADVGDLADTDLGAGRRFEQTDDLAPILGDIIPVKPFRAAMSFGDLIALFGIAAVAGDLARYTRRGSRWSLAGAMAGLIDRGRPESDAPEPPVEPDEIIDLDAYARLSAGEWLATQTIGKVGVGGEQVRILDVGTDSEELRRAHDVVDAEDRILR